MQATAMTVLDRQFIYYETTTLHSPDLTDDEDESCHVGFLHRSTMILVLSESGLVLPVLRNGRPDRDFGSYLVMRAPVCMGDGDPECPGHIVQPCKNADHRPGAPRKAAQS